jgi:diadenosine tetraphosphate (Ap4A) HIT family hydrolase
MDQIKCLFCDFFTQKKNILFESNYFFTIKDEHPVNKGHTLIIPKRHQTDIFALNTEEWNDLRVVINKIKDLIDKEFAPDGYNLGVNCGEYAGQSVFHLHVHVIPRYKGDVEKPRGGIRNFKKPLVEY